MTGVGLRIGETADREKLRYGAVFIAADEDEDGKNITALLIMFFYKFWPELFQDKKNPFLFKFSTPVHVFHEKDGASYSQAVSHDPELIHLTNDGMINGRTDRMFSAKQIDNAGVFGLDDFDDLNRVILTRPHASRTENPRLGARAEPFHHAVIRNVYGHGILTTPRSASLHAVRPTFGRPSAVIRWANHGATRTAAPLVHPPMKNAKIIELRFTTRFVAAARSAKRGR